MLLYIDCWLILYLMPLVLVYLFQIAHVNISIKWKKTFYKTTFLIFINFFHLTWDINQVRFIVILIELFELQARCRLLILFLVIHFLVELFLFNLLNL